MILFVSGTDTAVGKTRVACALAEGLRRHNPAVMKPIATGAVRRRGRWCSEDALRLMRSAGIPFSQYDSVNPILFRPPVSPHLAARAARSPIRLQRLQTRLYNMERPAGIVVAEGVGGVATPLTDGRTWADFMALFPSPRTVLVCAARVGTLNHTLSSLEYLQRRGIRCIFLVIGNHVASNIRHRENRRELERLTRLPVFVHPHSASRIAGNATRLETLILR